MQRILAMLLRLVNVSYYGKERTTTRNKKKDLCNNFIDELNFSKSWVFLGVAYTGLEDDEEAENSYKRAIEINPDNMLGWHGLVSFYEKRNKKVELAKTIQELLPRIVQR